MDWDLISLPDIDFDFNWLEFDEDILYQLRLLTVSPLNEAENHEAPYTNEEGNGLRIVDIEEEEVFSSHTQTVPIELGDIFIAHPKRKSQVSSGLCFRCTECHRKYANVDAHIIRHHATAMECFECHRTFRTMRQLRMHLKQPSQATNKICHICGEQFVNSSRLGRHISGKHGSTYTFTCHHCLKTFHARDNLTKHIKTHSDIRPFACSHCTMVFKTSSAKRAHENRHSLAKEHSCKVCGKAFRVKSMLELHLRGHTGERPYRCLYCEKKFADGSSRTQHQRLHTGERPYRCEMCSYQSTTSSNLKAHYRRRHQRDFGRVGMQRERQIMDVEEPVFLINILFR